MTQNSSKNKYFLYARKSSEAADRQVASIDSQIKELNIVAKREGLEIIDTIKEEQSAKKPGRPKFSQMLNRINKNEAQGVICWKLDRLARNPVDGGSISWMLQQGVIKHIQTFERSYYPTDNVLMMNVEFGMANQFIRDLSENSKRGLRAKAENGWYPALATLGYMQDPLKKKGKKEIIIDTERFDLVRKMFDLMLTGNYTPPKIWRIATDKWGFRNRIGNKIARSNIYRIFTDPFYYGRFEYPKGSGKWYQGMHKPMITIKEYDKIQMLLGRKGKPRPKSHDFAFTGMIECGECGAMITAEEKIKKQKNGNIHHYTYYHCTKKKNPNCSQKVIENKKLEEQIAALLETIEIPQDFCLWALDLIKNENQKEAEDRNKISANVQQQYNASIKKIDNLINMCANSRITEEEFAQKKSIAEREKMHFWDLLNDTDTRTDDWFKKMEQAFNFAQSAKEKFEKGTIEEKKEVLSILGSNLSLKDKKLSITIQKPLLLIKQVSPQVKEIHNRLEPVKNITNKRTLSVAYTQSPTMLRWLDSIRTCFG